MGSCTSAPNDDQKNYYNLDGEKLEKDVDPEVLIALAKKKGILNDEEQYIHKVNDQNIDCPNMLKSKTNNPSRCKIYSKMIQKNQFNKKNLKHLRKYKHFNNEYEEKPECKHGDQCKSFLRCESGVDENKIEDKCHMKLFRHPPRKRIIKLGENLNSLITNKSLYDNYECIQPNATDRKKYGWNKSDGWLRALIDEVINNGFKYDLCLKCGKNDECKHDVYDEQNPYSLLTVVEEKLNEQRHVLMGSPLTKDKMLALVLYTGCDCNYDLCSSQRKGKFGGYIKWKWFDYCLYKAIEALSEKEAGKFMVYSGLKGVKMDKKLIKSGYFVTFVSTSWKRKVARSFIGKGNKGMIIQFEKDYKAASFIHCCDVSWISKFPDECEVLFTRSIAFEEFECQVLDEYNGIQTVSLKTSSRSPLDMLMDDL